MEIAISEDASRDIQVRLENFLKDSIKNGLAHSWSGHENKWIKPYPEVTGYLLSYFASEAILKVDLSKCVDKLLTMQLEDGSWPSFFGDLENGFTFDTAQILSGLIAQNWISNQEVEISIQRGLAFISRQTRFGFPLSRSRETVGLSEMLSSKSWAHGITPINFKLAELLNMPQLASFADSAVWDKKRKSLKRLVHFFPQIREAHPGAYQLEGLWALGAKNLVESRLKTYFEPDSSGYIPAFPNAEYSYNSGSAQIGILWAKCGYPKQAQRILHYLIDSLESWNDTQLCMPQFSGRQKPHDEYSTWGIKYTCELLGLMREEKL